MTTKKPPAADSDKPSGKVPFRISQTALASARTKPPVAGASGSVLPQQRFTPYQPPPSIKAKMAMDDASSSALNWANQFIFAGAFSEGMAFMGYPELSILAQRAEYRRISEVLATEMTRKWIKLSAATADTGIEDEDPDEAGESEEGSGASDLDPTGSGSTSTSDPDEEDDESDEPDEDEESETSKALKLKNKRVTELEEELERFNVREHFRKMAEGDGLYGKSHLFVELEEGTKNKAELAKSIGAGDTELSLAKMKKGSLRSFKPVEAVWCYPLTYNSSDPLDDHWYKPETWKVMSDDVHYTRLLTFVGREVPDLLKPAYNFGGLSMTQMAKPYVDNWLRTRQSVSDLIYNFSTNVLQTDMSVVNQDQGEQSLFDRIDFFNAIKNNRGTMVIDKEAENYLNVAVPLGGLEQLQAQAQEHMAAVSGIPIVKLLGIQPSGLNASSEGEIRTFYDWVGAFQEKFFRPHLQTVIWFVMLNLWGEIDKDIKFTFVPLWEMTPEEKANIRKIDAETGGQLITEGVIDPAEERERIASDPESLYHNLDPEKTPEPKQNEMAGLDPETGEPMGNPEEESDAGKGESGHSEFPPEHNVSSGAPKPPKGTPRVGANTPAKVSKAPPAARRTTAKAA